MMRYLANLEILLILESIIFEVDNRDWVCENVNKGCQRCIRLGDTF